MSISALEALEATGLLDKNGKAASLAKIDPRELQKKLDYYRDTRIRFADRDVKEGLTEQRDMAVLVSSVSAANAVIPLLPSCFVYNRIYTNDPLIRLARNSNDIAKAHSESLGFDPERLADPRTVANKLLYFERLAPLIRLGCVTVLPLEDLHSPPSEGMPVFYSEDWFRSEVPEHIHDFVHNNAIISEMTPGPRACHAH